MSQPNPNLNWQKVYITGNLNGKVPIAFYETGNENLPGGHTESDETVETTLFRELIEEINCDVVNWQPIGYQKLTRLNGNSVSQLRYYAELRKRGEFSGDDGESVIGYRLVRLDQLNSRMGHGAVGERIIDSIRLLY